MDAQSSALNLPNSRFSAVRVMDIWTRHPKITRTFMDGSGGIKKARTDTDYKTEFRGHL